MSMWKSVKETLSYTITKTAFNQYFANATGKTSDDTLTIYFNTPRQLEWVENRLKKIVAKAAAQHGIKSVQFQLAENNPTEADTFTTEAVYTDPTKQFVPVSIYALRFWQPLLGKDAFALWMTLRAFAWDSKTKVWASIETLADICTNGNRHKITGRNAYSGRPATRGLLDILKEYNFARVKTTGTTGDRRYTFQVLADPPLLTPNQAAQLTPRLQHQHQEWLERHRVNRAQWELIAQIHTAGKEGKSPTT